MKVTVVIPQHCAFALPAVFVVVPSMKRVRHIYIYIYEKVKERNGKTLPSIVFSSSPRGHQSCQLLIFLKATKHTRQCVCLPESRSGCVLALSDLQPEQFGQPRLAVKKLKR